MKRLRPLVVLWSVISAGCADGAAIYERSVDYARTPAAHSSAPEAPYAPPSLLGQGASPAVIEEPPPGEVLYTCSMHPEISLDAPGRCPKCGMGLIPRPKGEGAPAHKHPSHEVTP